MKTHPKPKAPPVPTPVPTPTAKQKAPPPLCPTPDPPPVRKGGFAPAKRVTFNWATKRAMEIQALTDALPTAPDVGHGAPDFYVYDENSEKKVRFANREEESPREVPKEKMTNTTPTKNMASRVR